MDKRQNSLQAVLERKKLEPAPEAEPERKPKRNAANDRKTNAGNAAKPSREGTTLIGGHFGQPVARQLAIIAAEEGTTKQALLTEAMDMLFVKKGKARISEL